MMERGDKANKQFDHVSYVGTTFRQATEFAKFYSATSQGMDDEPVKIPAVSWDNRGK